MKELFIMWHLGLGDAIICNGLIRWIVAHRGMRVVVPAILKYADQVRFMFRDNPAITVVGVVDDADMEYKASCSAFHITIGNKRDGWADRTTKFDREFYAHADVDFTVRWDWFFVARDSLKEHKPRREPFIFIHDDEARGWKIETASKSAMRPNSILSPVMFHYMKVLEAAEEIHCIDSAFACLVDSMPENGQELFYHKLKPIADDRGSLTKRRKWVEV